MQPPDGVLPGQGQLLLTGKTPPRQELRVVGAPQGEPSPAAPLSWGGRGWALGCPCKCEDVAAERVRPVSCMCPCLWHPGMGSALTQAAWPPSTQLQSRPQGLSHLPGPSACLWPTSSLMLGHPASSRSSVPAHLLLVSSLLPADLTHPGWPVLTISGSSAGPCADGIGT